MNQYELAILRILLKSTVPLSKSKIVEGSPDDSSDFALSAISDLKRANFIVATNEGFSNEMLELAKDRKRDVIMFLNPSQNDLPADRSESKGKRMMWITATLMIMGAFASVYMAYAAGVNDRVASSQLQPPSYQDVKFGVVRWLPEGYAADIAERPTATLHLKPLNEYSAKTEALPKDISVKYYLAPEFTEGTPAAQPKTPT